MASRASEEQAALDWYERRRDEFLAAAELAKRDGHDEQAIALARSSAPFFIRRPYWQEGEVVLASGLAAAGRAGDQEAVAELSNAIGFLHHGQGRLMPATEDFGEALAAYELAGDAVGRARTLMNLGLTQRLLGLREDARESFARAVAAWRETPVQREVRYRLGLARSLNDLGLTLSLQGEREPAFQALGEALQIREDAGDEIAAADTLVSLGDLALNGDPEGAIRFYSQALELRRSRGEPGAGGVARRLAYVYAGLGRAEEAWALLDETSALDDVEGDAHAALRLAHLQLAEGVDAVAVREARRAFVLFGTLGLSALGAQALLVLAEVALRAGDLSTANDLLRQATELLLAARPAAETESSEEQTEA